MMTLDTYDHEKTDTEAINSKTIILWGKDDVLLRSVEMLLETKQDWKVLRISDDWDDGTLVQEVMNAAPDVFILQQETFIKKMHLFVKFAEEFSTLKILTVSLENNLVNIYSRQTTTIKEAKDLFSIIESNLDANLQGGAMK